MLAKPRIYIAIATFFPWVGGAETQTLALSQRLRERGYSVTIITFRHDKSWRRREVIEGVSVIRIAGWLLGYRQKLPRPFQQLFYLLALGVMSLTLWRHHRRYDVLHVQQLNLLALPTALSCRFTRKPMIISIRSASPGNQPFFTATSGLQTESAPRFTGDLENLERLGKPAARFTYSLLERVQAVVVILSSRMKSYLALHNFHPSNIQLIPNGVDTMRFIPLKADAGATGREQTVVCVSRMSREKGIDVLLRAWQRVQERMSEAKLIIVGQGPLQAQLEEMARVLDITGSVEFAGLQGDIPAQFHRGCLAVLPSHLEGMPNALLEAMACGLACVATRVSGSEDIVEHGVNGLLVEPGDYESMADALLTLLRDPVLVWQYGQAARRRIEQHYTLERNTEMYEELYQRVAGQKKQMEGPIVPLSI